MMYKGTNGFINNIAKKQWLIVEIDLEIHIYKDKVLC
jgi:hypothetical protein